MIFRPDLILIDGTSYIYRAFHALPPLTTSSGKPTGATRGFASMLRKLIEKYPSIPMVMVFDACLLYTSPSPRDGLLSRMPSSA